jgi:uncharacterized protein (DUF2267 family)
VRYEEFRQRVEHRLGGNRSGGEADKAITATLQTLSERITGGEARDLAEQLPGALQAPLQQADELAEDFSIEEFFWRVAEREGVDVDKARNDVPEVMAVLAQALTQGELNDVMTQLPPEFNARLFRS